MGGPAIAEGVGEDLSKIKKMPKLPLVILTPNVRVPTKWVFEKFQNPANDNLPTNVELAEALPVQFATKKSIIKYLNNDLEMVTVSKYPVVEELKKILTKTGAMACQMTGSGPTVFGIYPNKETAEVACNKIKAKLLDCRVFLAENIA